MKVTVSSKDGLVVVKLEPDDDAALIQGVRVETPDGPIVEIPFHLHGRRLHTICSQLMDDDTVWGVEL